MMLGELEDDNPFAPADISLQKNADLLQEGPVRTSLNALDDHL